MKKTKKESLRHYLFWATIVKDNFDSLRKLELPSKKISDHLNLSLSFFISLKSQKNHSSSRGFWCKEPKDLSLCILMNFSFENFFGKKVLTSKREKCSRKKYQISSKIIFFRKFHVDFWSFFPKWFLGSVRMNPGFHSILKSEK